MKIREARGMIYEWFKSALKVISIIIIVIAAIGILGGGMMAAGGAALAAVDSDSLAAAGFSASEVATYESLGVSNMSDAGMFIAIFGVIVAVISLFHLIVGILGVRGSNNPAKIGAFRGLALVGVILALASVIAGLMQNPIQYSPALIVNLVLILICLLLANSVKKSAAAQQA